MDFYWLFVKPHSWPVLRQSLSKYFRVKEWLLLPPPLSPSFSLCLFPSTTFLLPFREVEKQSWQLVNEKWSRAFVFNCQRVQKAEMCISNGRVGRNSCDWLLPRSVLLSPPSCVCGLVEPSFRWNFKLIDAKKKRTQRPSLVTSCMRWWCDGGPTSKRETRAGDGWQFVFFYYFPSYLDKVN